MMLTIAPVLRKPTAPIRETRVAPRPHVRMEYPGLSCPIDQRPLPTIEGVGLEAYELRRVQWARNRAEAAFSLGCDPSDLDLVASVGRDAAREELKRVLRERAHARPPVVKPRRDAGDEAWLAAMSRDFEVSPIKRLVEGRRKSWDAACEVDSGLVGARGVTPHNFFDKVTHVYPLVLRHGDCHFRGDGCCGPSSRAV